MRAPVGLVLAFCAALSAPARAQQAAGDADATDGARADGAFFDGFDGLDRDRWYVSDGWTNGDHQSCLWQQDRVRVADGRLRLSLESLPGGDPPLACAEVQSNARFAYGTFEARMKVPYAVGLNANMFTYIGPPQNKPHQEIDFEFIAPDGPSLQTNVHFDGQDPRPELLEMDDDGAFRTYSMIWEPERIRWFIDGVQIREARGGSIPDEAQKLYLSLWSSDRLTGWMGDFEARNAPQVLEVDWVAYSPPGSDCRFEGSVLCGDAAGDRRDGADAGDPGGARPEG